VVKFLRYASQLSDFEYNRMTDLLQRSVTGLPWLKNYVFNYDFGAPWRQCSVTFTSVAGHIVSQDFEGRFKGWNNCNPGDLFDAPITSFVQDVGSHTQLMLTVEIDSCNRTRKPFPRILQTKPGTTICYTYGQIVIEKARTSALKSETLLVNPTRGFK
jgi:hypothetical protein